MVYLTRVEHFNAAHKLYNPAWTPEKNDEMFGKCANENWHGHNYELFVTVKGDPHPDTGFVMDVKRLSILIKEQVLEKVDARLAECVDLKFFCGHSFEEIAVLRNVSERTVRRDWEKARLLLNGLIDQED